MRLVAKILRDLLQQQAFADLADVTEALKCRCARLKIRDYSRLVFRACDLVGSNHPLVTVMRRHDVVVPPADPQSLSRTEAAALCLRFGVAIKALPRTSGRRLDIHGPVRDVVDTESLIAGGR